jgi:hypothetical protein
MSDEPLLPLKHVLRKLYNDANHDEARNEYISSAFWQVFLQRAFYEDEYIVICEYPPNNSRRRVDIVVRRFVENEDTLSSVVFHEAKGPDGSARTVEDQVLDAATRAMERDQLHGIYAITTIGTGFRAWYVEAKEHPFLTSISGPENRPAATRAEYIDIDSEEGFELLHAIGVIKSDPPLRKAPVVPSQFLARPPETDSGGSQAATSAYSGGDGVGIDYTMHETAGFTHTTGIDYAIQEPAELVYTTGVDYTMEQSAGHEQEPWPLQPVAGYEGSENFPDSSGQGMYAGVKGEPIAGPSGLSGRSDGGSGKRVQIVTVRTETHRLHADKFLFEDDKGKTRTTEAKDWFKATYQGKRVWVFHGKKTTYISEEKIK